MAPVFLTYLLRQLTTSPQPVPSSVSLTGKTALIIGGSRGIGLETSRLLLQHGLSNLVITSRSHARAESAITTLRSSAPQNANPAISFQTVDLASYDSIFSFIDSLKQEGGGQEFDYVLLCAGIRKYSMQASSYGREMTVQVNHISVALLTLLLLPLMKKGSGTMTTASSETHAWSPFPEKDAAEVVKEVGKMDRTIGAQYDQSKMLNIFWQRELAERVPKESVVINYANPGFAATEMGSEAQGVEKFVINIFIALLARKPKVAARIFVDALTKGPDSHGKYLCGRGINIPLDPLIESDEGKQLQKKIWEETINILGEETGKRIGVSLDS